MDCNDSLRSGGFEMNEINSVIVSNLKYCENFGMLLWKIKPRGARSDGIAGTLHEDRKGKKYIYVCISGKKYRAHRLIWFIVHGYDPDFEIDHIDGDGTNNRIENLRRSDECDNKKNRSLQENNSSGFNGVRKHTNGNGWIAEIQIDKKRIHLGYFDNVADAINARKKANEEYGFYERHGKEKRK